MNRLVLSLSQPLNHDQHNCIENFCALLWQGGDRTCATREDFRHEKRILRGDFTPRGDYST